MNHDAAYPAHVVRDHPDPPALRLIVDIEALCQTASGTDVSTDPSAHRKTVSQIDVSAPAKALVPLFDILVIHPNRIRPSTGSGNTQGKRHIRKRDVFVIMIP